MTREEERLVRGRLGVIRMTPDEVVLAADPDWQIGNLGSHSYIAFMGLAMVPVVGAVRAHSEALGLLAVPLIFLASLFRRWTVRRRLWLRRWTETVTLRRHTGLAEISFHGFRGALPFREFSMVGSRHGNTLISVGGRELVAWYPYREELEGALKVLRAFSASPIGVKGEQSIWAERGTDLARLFKVVGADNGGLSLQCRAAVYRPFGREVLAALFPCLVFLGPIVASILLLPSSPWLFLASLVVFLAAPSVFYWGWNWKSREGWEEDAVLRVSRDGDLFLQRSPIESPTRDRFGEGTLAFEQREVEDFGTVREFVYCPSDGAASLLIVGGDVSNPEGTLALLRGVVDMSSGPYR